MTIKNNSKLDPALLAEIEKIVSKKIETAFKELTSMLLGKLDEEVVPMLMGKVEEEVESSIDEVIQLVSPKDEEEVDEENYKENDATIVVH